MSQGSKPGQEQAKADKCSQHALLMITGLMTAFEVLDHVIQCPGD